MLVKNWMTPKPVTVGVEDSMDRAIRVLREHRIKLLPVMDKGRIAGVITDRDLKRASASDATTLDIHELMYLISRIKVRDIMSPNPVTVPFDFTIEETAEILLKNKISGVPVVDHDGGLVGVITQSDIFRVLISLTGFGKRGIQLSFVSEDRPGSIKELADIVRLFGGRLASILTSYEKVKEGTRKIYIRTYGLDRSRMEELKQALSKKAKLLYMVDHRDNRREIYAE